jgi:hypothetical protein
MIASSFVNTPRIGGWLCATHRQIEFTPEEKRKLAEVIGKAAVGIAGAGTFCSRSARGLAAISSRSIPACPT